MKAGCCDPNAYLDGVMDFDTGYGVNGLWLELQWVFGVGLVFLKRSILYTVVTWWRADQ